MPVTYKKIASVTVGAGGASSIDFQNIPSIYDDITCLLSLRAESLTGAPQLLLEINASTANRTWRRLIGSGSTAGSNNDTTAYIGTITGSDSTASTFGSHAVYIPNYAGSTNKSLSVDNVTENNATTAYAVMTAVLWSNTSAITRLTFKTDSTSDFNQYSTATLYGISKS